MKCSSQLVVVLVAAPMVAAAPLPHQHKEHHNHEISTPSTSPNERHHPSPNDIPWHVHEKRSMPGSLPPGARPTTSHGTPKIEKHPSLPTGHHPYGKPVKISSKARGGRVD
ncbi:hypothetical protein PIIN_09625 [Serendipita indica DSM 11827]|uniref:Uncharacterized protein n=1 Tax=Serendipita indica (strain DSM 11827) TaxID=1109443 RepID=G4TWE1_SERID|nr:hypothetical protein PIIN_09625 [Serendipita indica DSM 11827]